MTLILSRQLLLVSAFVIATDIKSHADLQAEVTAYLEQSGFVVSSAAYHDVMEDCAVEVLKTHTNPTSLYVRTRSDRIAAHKSLDLSFLVELKTNTGRYHNMALEALPLAHHRHVFSLGVSCLYVYRDPMIEVEGSFWASDELPINRIIIPDKWRSLRPYLERAYPAVKLVSTDRVSGSNDPFAIISQADLPRVLSDWKAEISAEVEMCAASEGLPDQPVLP